MNSKVVSDLKTQYFNWLCGMIDPTGPSSMSSKKTTYYILLDRLHNYHYSYHLSDGETSNDCSRYEDGVHLRYQFLYEKGYNLEWKDYVLYGPCSMLEMLVAIADKSFINYPYPPNKIFWMMMKNMNLCHCDDDNFDFENLSDIDRACELLCNREYNERGVPGPFRVYDGVDARKMELWSQMLDYTNYISRTEEIKNKE